MQAGRLKVLGFGAGFVVAQALTCSIFVIMGVAAAGSERRNRSGVQVTIELLLALALSGLDRLVRCGA